MSSTRSKLQLDEQSFQGLLAAAFTIQEHADLLKGVKEVTSKLAPEPEAAAPRLCPHCSAPLKKDESRCGQCGLEEFRSGERMQKKFASLWEMSQEHGVHQERSPQQNQESVLELGSSGLSTLSEAGSQSPGHRASHHDAEQNETQWETEPPIDVEQPIHSISLTTSEENSLQEANPSARLRNALFNLGQQISLYRADLYLGMAVLVAILALLWPAPASPQKPRLAPWQRVLVKLGIAEAPAPQIHYRGDPNIEVWVDPHTALYYCPGDEPYGKTADGRLTNQRDAQSDQFEPANRAACN